VRSVSLIASQARASVLPGSDGSADPPEESRGIVESGQRIEERLVRATQRGIVVHEMRHGEAARAHLDRVLDRDQRLRPQRIRAAVPEEPARVRDTQ
jgi:hypothetical protein